MCTVPPSPDNGVTGCYGDSGGPLYDKDRNILVGVTSGGPSHCAEGAPHVYSRIADQVGSFSLLLCTIYSWEKFNADQIHHVLPLFLFIIVN